VANVSVTIPDISRITADQAHQLANVVNTVNLVQNGPNNTFTPDAGTGAAAATVIQNTLSSQTLQSLTTINAAVNSLPQFRQLNLGSVLQSALANVVNLH
jgi:mannitol-specific phosphotransferase system IIBC component